MCEVDEAGTALFLHLLSKKADSECVPHASRAEVFGRNRIARKPPEQWRRRRGSTNVMMRDLDLSAFDVAVSKLTLALFKRTHVRLDAITIFALHHDGFKLHVATPRVRGSRNKVKLVVFVGEMYGWSFVETMSFLGLLVKATKCGRILPLYASRKVSVAHPFG